jgi:hypothetical protein
MTHASNLELRKVEKKFTICDDLKGQIGFSSLIRSISVVGVSDFMMIIIDSQSSLNIASNRLA